jgi:hypothetical protein
MQEVELPTWADSDEKMTDRFNKVGIKISADYLKELKSTHPELCTRPIKSSYADGFRCGIQWVLENPGQFMVIIIKSFFRRGISKK